MHAHDEMEHILDRLKNVFAIVNVHVELAFNRIVHKDTGTQVVVVVLIVPVRLEGDRYAVPTVWVDVAEAVTAAPDDTFREDVRLLLQVHVVRVGVVKGAHLCVEERAHISS